VSPYSTGNGENTVKFLQKIKKRHPEQRLLLIWDGASYHRGEEMKKLLAIENEEKRPEEWSITCQLLAPYAPEFGCKSRTLFGVFTTSVQTSP
jgi:hypothetical protein